MFKIVLKKQKVGNGVLKKAERIIHKRMGLNKMASMTEGVDEDGEVIYEDVELIGSSVEVEPDIEVIEEDEYEDDIDLMDLEEWIESVERDNGLDVVEVMNVMEDIGGIEGVEEFGRRLIVEAADADTERAKAVLDAANKLKRSRWFFDHLKDEIIGDPNKFISFIDSLSMLEADPKKYGEAADLTKKIDKARDIWNKTIFRVIRDKVIKADRQWDREMWDMKWYDNGTMRDVVITSDLLMWDHLLVYGNYDMKAEGIADRDVVKEIKKSGRLHSLRNWYKTIVVLDLDSTKMMGSNGRIISPNTMRQTTYTRRIKSTTNMRFGMLGMLGHEAKKLNKFNGSDRVAFERFVQFIDWSNRVRGIRVIKGMPWNRDEALLGFLLGFVSDPFTTIINYLMDALVAAGVSIKDPRKWLDPSYFDRFIDSYITYMGYYGSIPASTSTTALIPKINKTQASGAGALEIELDGENAAVTLQQTPGKANEWVSFRNLVWGTWNAQPIGKEYRAMIALRYKRLENSVRKGAMAIIKAWESVPAVRGAWMADKIDFPHGFPWEGLYSANSMILYKNPRDMVTAYGNAIAKQIKTKLMPAEEKGDWKGKIDGLVSSVVNGLGLDNKPVVIWSQWPIDTFTSKGNPECAINLFLGAFNRDFWGALEKAVRAESNGKVPEWFKKASKAYRRCPKTSESIYYAVAPMDINDNDELKMWALLVAFAPKKLSANYTLPGGDYTGMYVSKTYPVLAMAEMQGGLKPEKLAGKFGNIAAMLKGVGVYTSQKAAYSLSPWSTSKGLLGMLIGALEKLYDETSFREIIREESRNLLSSYGWIMGERIEKGEGTLPVGLTFPFPADLIMADRNLQALFKVPRFKEMVGGSTGREVNTGKGQMVTTTSVGSKGGVGRVRPKMIESVIDSELEKMGLEEAKERAGMVFRWLLDSYGDNE